MISIQKIYITSFEGNGYAEYPSRPMTRDRFKFGFSFKTTSPSGLLFLSAFTRTVRSFFKFLRKVNGKFPYVYLEKPIRRALLRSVSGERRAQCSNQPWKWARPYKAL